MKISLYAFVLLAAAAGAACSDGSTQNNPGSSPPSNQTPVAAVTPTPHESLPKIVAFGDSLTVGLGLNRESESYPAVLQKKLDADGYKYEVVNAGVSAETSAGGLSRINWILDSGGVRVVILELGANDFLRGQPVAETKKNLAEIIRRVKARGAQVLLAGMLTTTNTGERYQREIHEAYRSLAREHQVPLIPFFLEGVAGREELNQADGVHPNAEGAKVIAETVYKHLRPMLDERKQD